MTRKKKNVTVEKDVQNVFVLVLKFGSGCNSSCGCVSSCQNMFNHH